MLKKLVAELPKAELHIHIEGSLEPEMMLELAQRNQVKLPYPDVDSINAAYAFNCLQDFLDVYYQGMSVLLQEEDFFDLAWAYLKRCKRDNVVHTEIFFDPQGHTERGVEFPVFMQGFSAALDRAHSELGISARLIMCFLRHLDEDSAFATLRAALPWQDQIHGVGLDSSELGHPPSKFERVFGKAGELGFKRVAHAGEEAPAEYVWEAIKLLQVDRIYHGNRAMDDGELVRHLADLQIPLTVCPQSNLRLGVIKDMREHPIKAMLDNQLAATVNSDDPAYFGGYLVENFHALIDALELGKDDILRLVTNGFRASFLSNEEIEQHLGEVKRIAEAYA